MKKFFFLILISFFIFFTKPEVKAATLQEDFDKLPLTGNYVVCLESNKTYFQITYIYTDNCRLVMSDNNKELFYKSTNGEKYSVEFFTCPIGSSDLKSIYGRPSSYVNSSTQFYPDSSQFMVASNVPITYQDGTPYTSFLCDNSKYVPEESRFEESEFDSSLGKLNIKSSRYLNTSTHIYHDFFTIDTTTSFDVDVTQPGYGIKCQVLFYGDNDYLFNTEYFNLTDYRFNFDWKSKAFENLSLPSLPEPDKFSQYRIFLFPYKEENGTIKRGYFSSVSYGDYVSGLSTSNTHVVGVHRVGATRPDGSSQELDTYIKPLPVISGNGLTLSDNDTINNKYVYEYHYPGEPDEITNNYISNNITNPDSIVDIPGNENVSDFDFGSIKAFLTGLYNFLFKLSKVLILWLGLPPFLATVLNLGLYVIVFLIFGSLFKKLF